MPKVARFKRERSLELTARRRPELIASRNGAAAGEGADERQSINKSGFRSPAAHKQGHALQHAAGTIAWRTLMDLISTLEHEKSP